jgi:hypothetical protein
MASAGDFYLRYYVGHTGKYGHEYLEFEFMANGEVRSLSRRLLRHVALPDPCLARPPDALPQ